MNFQFRALSLDDKPLMMNWLSRPHFLKWWGAPNEEWALIETSLKEKDCFPFFALYGETPVAYIQYWPISLARGKVEAHEEIWLSTLSDHVIGVDMSLADGASLGRGMGRQILSAFVQKLRSEGFEEIIIDPDIRNLRAIGCYRAAGFKRIAQYPEREGGTLLMRWAQNAHAGNGEN